MTDDRNEPEYDWQVGYVLSDRGQSGLTLVVISNRRNHAGAGSGELCGKTNSHAIAGAGDHRAFTCRSTNATTFFGSPAINRLRGPGSRAAYLADLLLDRSAEFRDVWDRQEVGLRPNEVKHFVHPELGALELACQSLIEPNQSHALLVYTATPGSESDEKLRLLSVIGAQTLR